MGTLYLIRHGQASFGAANYDQLSALGSRQSVRLGEYFATRGLRFDTVMMGTLARHRQTWEGIAQGGGYSHAPVLWPGLNEYDSEAVVRAVHPGPLPKADTPEQYRHHFRLLREGLSAWMQGATAPTGMPGYTDFARGVAEALDHVRKTAQGDVLLVSSGGPISTAVGQVLGTPAATTIELNLRIRNASVTEMAFTPKRHMLHTFNTLPHLEGPEFESWITFA